MNGETEILDLMRNLAKESGRIISLSNLYRISLQNKIINDASKLKQILKKLESSGKIKSIKFGISVELLDHNEIEEPFKVEKINYVQATLKDL